MLSRSRRRVRESNRLAVALVALVVVLSTVGPFVGVGVVAAVPTDVTGCTLITTPGVYRLADPVTATTAPSPACLVVGADDIVVDGGGNTLSGPGSGTGVLVTAGVQNTTVRSLTLSDWDVGVAVSGSSRVELSGLRVTDVVVHGVSVEGSTDVTVADSSIDRFDTDRTDGEIGAGVAVTLSDLVTVSGTDVTRGTSQGFGPAIRLDDTTNSIVRANRVFHDTEIVSGIIVIGDSDDVIVAGNTLTNATVAVADSTDVTVNDNVWTAIGGLRLGNADRAQVRDNDVIGLLRVGSSEGVVVSGNDVTADGGDGIWLAGALDSTVVDNAVLDAGIGLRIDDGSDNNTLVDNTVGGDTRVGVRLRDATDTELSTTVVDTTGYTGSGDDTGIEVLGTVIGNLLFDNSFNSTLPVNFFAVGANEWNATRAAGTNIVGGDVVGGNYWASPGGTGFSQTCTDDDGDGICDSAFVIGSGNVDSLPLTTPTLGPPPVESDPYEPNDRLVDATVVGVAVPIEPDVPVFIPSPFPSGEVPWFTERTLSDAVVAPGDEDWYRVDAAEHTRVDVTLNFTNATGDLSLAVRDENDLPVDAGESATDDEFVRFVADLPDDSDGLRSYYVVVSGADGTVTNEYDLTVAVTNDRFEPNDDRASATPVTVGALPAFGGGFGGLPTFPDPDSLPVVEGSLLLDDDQDYFTFTVSERSDALVVVDASDDVFVSVASAGGVSVSPTSGPTGATDSAQLIFGGDDALDPGTYSVRVVAPDDARRTHSLLVLAGPSDTPAPGNDPYESNDVRADAFFAGVAIADSPDFSIPAPSPLPGGEPPWFTGRTLPDGVLVPGEKDWFRVEADQYTRVDVDLRFSQAEGNLSLDVYDENGALMGRSRSGSSNEFVRFVADRPRDGDRIRSYYVLVYGADDAVENDYSLSLSVTNDRFEPNDARSSATPVTTADLPAFGGGFGGFPTFPDPNSLPIVGGLLLVPGDQDYYTFTVTEQSEVAVVVDASDDVFVSVTSVGGVSVAPTSGPTGASEDPLLIFAGTEALDPGPYYVRVVDPDSPRTAYSLLVLANETGAPAPGNDPYESNDLRADAFFAGVAVPVDPGVSFPVPTPFPGAGTAWFTERTFPDGVVVPGERDWFRVEADQFTRVDVGLQFSQAEGDLSLQVYDENGGFMGESTTATDDEFVRFVADRPRDGDRIRSYYVVIYGADDAVENDYDLTIAVTNDRFEPNDDRASATPVTVGEIPSLGGGFGGFPTFPDPDSLPVVGGGLLVPGDQDYFTFAVSERSDALVVVDASDDVFVSVTSAGGVSVSPTSGPTGATDSAQLIFGGDDALDPGTYSVRVVDADAARTGYSVLVLAGAVPDGTPGPASDPYDPNDRRAEAFFAGIAVPVDPGVSFPVPAPFPGAGTAWFTERSLPDGTVTPGERDWFRVDAPEHARVDVALNFTHADGDLSVQVFTERGRFLGQGTTATDDEFVRFVADVPDDDGDGVSSYYVIVYGADAAVENDYDLSFAVTGDRFDPNEDRASARPITTGPVPDFQSLFGGGFGGFGFPSFDQFPFVDGLLLVPGDQDYFEFAVGDDADAVVFVLADDPVDVSVANDVGLVVGSTTAPTDTAQLFFAEGEGTALAAGNYTVRVTSPGDDRTPYRLLVLADAPPPSVTFVPDSSQWNVDVGDYTAGVPVPVTLNAPVTPTITLDSLRVVTTTAAPYTLNVTGSATPPDGTVPLSTAVSGATELGYLTVDHSVADANVSVVVFRFVLARQALAEAGVDPDDVLLYRYVNGVPTVVPTTLVDSGPTTYGYDATSPGLSVFAVGAVAAPDDVIGPGDGDGGSDAGGDGRLDDGGQRTDVVPGVATFRIAGTDGGGSVVASEMATVVASVENRGGRPGTYVVALSADGEQVASTEVRIDPDESRSVALSFTPDTPGRYALAVNGVDAGELLVTAPETTATPTPEPTPEPDSEPTAGVGETTSDGGEREGTSGSADDAARSPESIAPGATDRPALDSPTPFGVDPVLVIVAVLLALLAAGLLVRRSR